MKQIMQDGPERKWREPVSPIVPTEHHRSAASNWVEAPNFEWRGLVPSVDILFDELIAGSVRVNDVLCDKLSPFVARSALRQHKKSAFSQKTMQPQ